MRGLSYLVCSFTLFISNIVNAETVDEMVAIMSQKLGDYNQLNESIVKGGLRVRLCQYCHGKDGNSVKDDVPNLAAQNPIYLLTQFEYFRTNERKNRVMNELAKNLTTEERINIALYYASQDVSHTAEINGSSGIYNRGKQIYAKVCVNCHGDKGHGQQSLPRIAGQKSVFLKQTLTNYKNNNGVRPDSPMIGVAAGLNQSDIEAIATYVATMK